MMFRTKGSKPREHRKPMHIKTGDEVIVISGEGRQDRTPHKVLSVQPAKRNLIVEGVNMMKDRQKKQEGGRASGINDQGFVEKPFPIDISNVALVDPRSKKPTRVRVKKQPDGKRARTAARSGETI